MSARKIIVALVAFALLAPATSALAQETAPEEGTWYYLEDAPSVAPKPPCGKKPNRRDSFKEMWLWQGGKYAECRWDPQGAKPKPVYTGWSYGSCLAAIQRGVSYDFCMAGGLNYTTPTMYFSGNFQPTYQGFQPGYGNGYQSSYLPQGSYTPRIDCRPANERPVCPNTGHPLCGRPPC